PRNRPPKIGVATGLALCFHRTKPGSCATARQVEKLEYKYKGGRHDRASSQNMAGRRRSGHRRVRSDVSCNFGDRSGNNQASRHASKYHFLGNCEFTSVRCLFLHDPLEQRKESARKGAGFSGPVGKSKAISDPGDGKNESQWTALHRGLPLRSRGGWSLIG